MQKATFVSAVFKTRAYSTEALCRPIGTYMYRGTSKNGLKIIYFCLFTHHIIRYVQNIFFVTHSFLGPVNYVVWGCHNKLCTTR